MAAKHGTRHRYVDGCSCGDCRAANRVYAADLRKRHADGGPIAHAVVSLRPVVEPASGPGRVEAAIRLETEGLALAAVRPALVETAISLARILDNPRAVSHQPAAAGKLADILDRLHKGAAARRGGLKVVRAMTDGGA